MKAELTTAALAFQAVASRAVVARFDGGKTSSDGGAVLLREVDRTTTWLGKVAPCFTHHRDPMSVTHPVASRVRHRVCALALGYSDLNDHDALRHDPLIAVLAASTDLAVPGAGKRTLNRHGLTGAGLGGKARYKKITVDHDAVDRPFVDVFVKAHVTPPTEITFDLVATDDPIHGAQEGRFFPGYYGYQCYLPLYTSPTSTCSARARGRRTSMRVPGRSRKCSASWRSCARCGPRCGSSSASTAVSVAMRS